MGLPDKFWAGHHFLLTSFEQVITSNCQVLDTQVVLTENFVTGLAVLTDNYCEEFFEIALKKQKKYTF